MKKRTTQKEKVQAAIQAGRIARIASLQVDNDALRQEVARLASENEFQNSMLLKQRDLLASLESVRQWAFTLAQQVKLLSVGTRSRLWGTTTVLTRDLDRAKYAADIVDKKTAEHAAVLAGIRTDRKVGHCCR